MAPSAVTAEKTEKAPPGSGGAFSRRHSKAEAKSRRIRERVKLMIPVRVLGRTSVDQNWNEMTRLIDVTPFGARFILTHMVEPGQLLHLLMPMPRALRCFDHAEEHYRVWSIVRNIRFLP